MPLALRINVRAGDYVRRVRRVQGRFKANELLGRIGDGLLAFVRRNFETGGVPVGGWRALRPNTVAAKGHARILIASGNLSRSYQARVIPGARVQVGTDNPIAKYHEFGTRGPYLIFPKQRDALGRFRRRHMLSFVTTAGRVFRPYVVHPGLPARRTLPNARETRDIAIVETRAFLREVLS